MFNPSFDLLTDNPCLDDPCENGGTCTVASNLLGFKCNCTSEYIGFNCGTLKGDIHISCIAQHLTFIDTANPRIRALISNLREDAGRLFKRDA